MAAPGRQHRAARPSATGPKYDRRPEDMDSGVLSDSYAIAVQTMNPATGTIAQLSRNCGTSVWTVCHPWGQEFAATLANAANRQ